MTDCIYYIETTGECVLYEIIDKLGPEGCSPENCPDYDTNDIDQRE